MRFLPNRLVLTVVVGFVLAAGLEGIRDNLDPGEPHFENLYTKSQQELDNLGVTKNTD